MVLRDSIRVVVQKTVSLINKLFRFVCLKTNDHEETH